MCVCACVRACVRVCVCMCECVCEREGGREGWREKKDIEKVHVGESGIEGEANKTAKKV